MPGEQRGGAPGWPSRNTGRRLRAHGERCSREAAAIANPAGELDRVLQEPERMHDRVKPPRLSRPVETSVTDSGRIFHIAKERELASLTAVVRSALPVPGPISLSGRCDLLVSSGSDACLT